MRIQSKSLRRQQSLRRQRIASPSGRAEPVVHGAPESVSGAGAGTSLDPAPAPNLKRAPSARPDHTCAPPPTPPKRHPPRACHAVGQTGDGACAPRCTQAGRPREAETRGGEGDDDNDRDDEATPPRQKRTHPPKTGGPCKKCGATESSQWFGVKNGAGPYCKKTKCEAEYQQVRPLPTGPGKRKRGAASATQVHAVNAAAAGPELVAPVNSTSFHSLLKIEKVLGAR